MFHIKSSLLKPLTQTLLSTISPLTQSTASIAVGCLRVRRFKDPLLDKAIVRDQQWRTCAKLAREVLNTRRQKLALKSLQKRSKKVGLRVPVHKFLNMFPGLFRACMARVRPSSPRAVPFVRPGPRLMEYVHERDMIYMRNEGWIVRKLCKLLMMSRHRVLSCAKLVEVKRDFGFPDDFLVNLVPKHPEYFRFIAGEKEGEWYLELVKWNDSYAKSAIELRAERETRRFGIPVRPAFDWRLPRRILYKKLMVEWIRDWMELPYVSPYAEEGWKFDSASREAEKRMVAVLHELLSLSLYKRMRTDSMGKFCEDYNYSNAFTKAFTRHQGLFYVSFKGPTKTIYLREAYRGSYLIDRHDPLLQVYEKFREMIEELKKACSKTKRLKKQRLEKRREEKAREPEIVFFDSD